MASSANRSSVHAPSCSSSDDAHNLPFIGLHSRLACRQRTLTPRGYRDGVNAAPSLRPLGQVGPFALLNLEDMRQGQTNVVLVVIAALRFERALGATDRIPRGQAVALPGHRIRCAYAETDCGLIFEGSSPAVRQIARETYDGR
jgi:hypothetical protein